jgi:oligopeptide transport system substrate-binding protein
VQHDVPWVFAFVPKQFGLVHGWLGNVKPNDLARNDLKYHRINSTLRAEQRQAWNQPQWWPLPLLLLAVLLLVWPAYHAWRKRQRQVGLRADLALNTPEVNAPNVNGLKPGEPLP